jgi:hypothetical protein
MGVAVFTRGLVAVLWMVLVLASSVLSLLFVNFRGFLATYGCCAFVPIGLLLASLHCILFYQAIKFLLLLTHYHDVRVALSIPRHLVVWCGSIIATGIFTGAAYVAAMCH